MQPANTNLIFQETAQRIEALASEAYDLLMSDVPRAQALVDEALEMATAVDPDDVQLAAPALAMHGSLLASNGEHVQATTVLLQVVTFADQGAIAVRWRLHAYNFLVICHRHMRYYSEALNWAQRMVELAAQHQDRANYGDALRHIGSLYYYLQQYDRNIETYERMLAEFNAVGDEGLRASVYNNLSMAYLKSGQPVRALEAAQQARAYFERINHPYGIVAVHDNIAAIALELDDTETARQAAEYAVSQSIESQAPATFYCESLITLAQVYLRINELELALQTLSQVESQIADDEVVTNVGESLYKTLAEVHVARGDTAAAYACYKRLYDEHIARDRANIESRFEYMATVFETRQALREAELQRQRAAEIEAQAARERQYFMQLNRMKDQFLDAATHDLKNPLATITIYAEMLRTRVPPELQTFVEKIDMQTVRMSQLIMEMLDLARLETGQAIVYKPMLVAEFLQTVVSEHAAHAAERQITLQLEVPASAQNLKAHFDANYLRRALDNLVSNAIKYTHIGDAVGVALSVHDAGFTITVKDNGPGIAADHLPNIFDRFYRVPSEASQQVVGNGLGLAITKTIIEQHGGTISVSSTVGAGTTFFVTLPL